MSILPPDFADLLLAWHRVHGRHDLPWQQPKEPYRVWVSEIMLQQTRVETVIPYFERFMARFPSLEALAGADVDEALHLWSGLGYYARARNLHRAAQLVCARHGGELPREFEALAALPGIGRSTAGAILSLGCGIRQAILDGNVRRVLARCFAIGGDPASSAVQQRLWALAEELTPALEAGAYNQAMMDLGATLCTRSAPDCPRCPLAGLCRARSEGNPTAYPTPRRRKELPLRSVQMLVIQNPAGELLLEKRPPVGIWGGLWSLPECDPQADPVEWCRRELGVEAAPLESLPPRRHTFSHFQLDILPRRLRLERQPQQVMEGERRDWYNPRNPIAHGLPAPVARIIEETGETDL